MRCYLTIQPVLEFAPESLYLVREDFASQRHGQISPGAWTGAPADSQFEDSCLPTKAHSRSGVGGVLPAVSRARCVG